MIVVRRRSRGAGQPGFTLLDLIVGLAITGLILSGILLTVYQVMFREPEVRDNSRAVAALQEIGYWVGQDAMNAQYLDVSVPNQLRSSYTVQWPTQDGYQHVYTYDVTYTYAANKIRRNEQVNIKTYNSDDGLLVSTNDVSRATLVAQNISAFQAQVADGVVGLSVTSSAGKYTETRDYRFTRRGT